MAFLVVACFWGEGGRGVGFFLELDWQQVVLQVAVGVGAGVVVGEPVDDGGRMDLLCPVFFSTEELF